MCPDGCMLHPRCSHACHVTCLEQKQACPVCRPCTTIIQPDSRIHFLRHYEQAIAKSERCSAHHAISASISQMLTAQLACVQAGEKGELCAGVQQWTPPHRMIQTLREGMIRRLYNSRRPNLTSLLSFWSYWMLSVTPVQYRMLHHLRYDSQTRDCCLAGAEHYPLLIEMAHVYALRLNLYGHFHDVMQYDE